MIRFIMALLFLALPANAGVLDNPKFQSTEYSMICHVVIGMQPAKAKFEVRNSKSKMISYTLSVGHDSETWTHKIIDRKDGRFAFKRDALLHVVDFDDLTWQLFKNGKPHGAVNCK